MELSGVVEPAIDKMITKERDNFKNRYDLVQEKRDTKKYGISDWMAC